MPFSTFGSYTGNYDYAKVVTELGSSSFKPLVHNLFLIRIDESTVGIRLYATTIIKFHEDGRIQLYADGYQTPTTSKAISKSLVDVSVGSSQNNYVVYADGIEYYFEDGITINADGSVDGRPVFLDRAERAAGQNFEDIEELIEFIKKAGDKALNKLFNRRHPAIRELVAKHAPLTYIPLMVVKAQSHDRWGEYARQRVG